MDTLAFKNVEDEKRIDPQDFCWKSKKGRSLNQGTDARILLK
jgi:hypothetical protein